MHRKLSAVLGMGLALFLAGCPANGPLVLARDAALANQAFERAVTTAHTDKDAGGQPFVDDATERRLLDASRKIAQADDAAVNAIQNQKDKKGAIANLDQAIATIDDAVTSGLAGIKNTGKQADLHAILLGLRGTLTTAKGMLSN